MEKSKIQRRLYGIRLDPQIMKQAKLTSVKMEINTNILIEQAIKEFLKQKGKAG